MWGGWHHVEVHDTDWWINKFQSYGFLYSPELSNQVKAIAQMHNNDLMPNGKEYKAQHLWLHMMVSGEVACSMLDMIKLYISPHPIRPGDFFYRSSSIPW